MKRVQNALLNFIHGNEFRQNLWSECLPEVTQMLNTKTSPGQKVAPTTAFRGRQDYSRFTMHDWQNQGSTFDADNYDNMIIGLYKQRQKRIDAFKRKHNKIDSKIKFTVSDHVYIIADRAKWPEYKRKGYKTTYDCTGVIIETNSINGDEVYRVLYTSNINMENLEKGSISRKCFSKNELDFVENDVLDKIISEERDKRMELNNGPSSSSASSSSSSTELKQEFSPHHGGDIDIPVCTAAFPNFVLLPSTCLFILVYRHNTLSNITTNEDSPFLKKIYIPQTYNVLLK